MLGGRAERAFHHKNRTLIYFITLQKGTTFKSTKLGSMKSDSTSNSCCPFRLTTRTCTTSGPGCRKCCSHPHGRGYNLAAASSAAIALLIDAAILAFWGWLPAVSLILITIGTCCGAVVVIVSFTASCRAYRRCGLKAIASLYGSVLLCHVFSFAEVATCMSIASERYWETGHCYWFLDGSHGSQIAMTVLVAISSLLWLISFVFILMVPPFKDSDIEDNATTTPRRSADHSSDTNEEGMRDVQEEMSVHITTVSAVPVPISEDEESPTLQYITCSGGGHYEKNPGPLEP